MAVQDKKISGKIPAINRYKWANWASTPELADIFNVSYKGISYAIRKMSQRNMLDVATLISSNYSELNKRYVCTVYKLKEDYR